MNRHLFLPALLLLACAGSAFAQSAPTPPPALPEWGQLTPQQRETLIAPLRDRWNESTDERARMYEHARRWQAMTPQQRELAQRGMHRFEHMDPQQRRDAKVLFVKMRGLSAEQRAKLRDEFKAMSPEQKRQWIRQNTPKDMPEDDPPPGPPR